MYAIVQEELRVHACIRIHTGKTKVWNRAGVRPEACNILERIARQDDKGSDIPTSEQALKILGASFGHPPTSWSVIWHTWPESNQCCWTESLWFQMFSPCGCCCCIARLPGRISS